MAERHERLDRSSPIPLYFQLFQRLESEIMRGMPPGSLLGTEAEIQARYGVSRATVRKALDELARAGRLARITGKGTFVTAAPLEIASPHLLSFTEEMKLRGITPGSVVLDFNRAPCPADAAQALRCREGNELLHIRRVRTQNQTPALVVDHYLAPFVRLRRDELRESLYETLEGTLGATLHEAYHTLSAGLSTEEENYLLRMPPQQPVLRFRRTTLDAEARPIVFERGSARADLYEYSVHLFRK